MIVYAVICVLIVDSFSTATAVVAQEIPGLLLIALVVVLIWLRVPRLRRIVHRRAGHPGRRAVTTNLNTEPAGTDHDLHHANDDPSTAITDQLRTSPACAATQHSHTTTTPGSPNPPTSAASTCAK